MVDPTNPIDILVRILIVLMLIFFGAMSVVRVSEDGGIIRGDFGRSPGQGGGGNVSLTVIEQVETLILESYPYQITLNVSGYQPDGCDLPVIVEQRREGNIVYVDIYRVLPPDVFCTMQLVPYQDTITLDGGFESGQYQINVNGTIVDVNL